MLLRGVLLSLVNTTPVKRQKAYAIERGVLGSGPPKVLRRVELCGSMSFSCPGAPTLEPGFRSLLPT